MKKYLLLGSTIFFKKSIKSYKNSYFKGNVLGPGGGRYNCNYTLVDGKSLINQYIQFSHSS